MHRINPRILSRTSYDFYKTFFQEISHVASSRILLGTFLRCFPKFFRFKFSLNFWWISPDFFIPEFMSAFLPINIKEDSSRIIPAIFPGVLLEIHPRIMSTNYPCYVLNDFSRYNFQKILPDFHRDSSGILPKNSHTILSEILYGIFPRMSFKNYQLLHSVLYSSGSSWLFFCFFLRGNSLGNFKKKILEFLPSVSFHHSFGHTSGNSCR